MIQCIHLLRNQPAPEITIDKNTRKVIVYYEQDNHIRDTEVRRQLGKLRQALNKYHKRMGGQGISFEARKINEN